MNQAAHLHRLQQLDTRLDQNNARLAEIDALLNEDETVRAARKAAEDARSALEKARQALRSIEFQAQDLQIRIDQANSSLYGGTIRNPKELQDLQKDIESLRRQLSALEDHQITAMVEVEQEEAADASLAQTLARTLSAVSEQKAGLVGEQTRLKKEVERLLIERQAALALIQATSLETYSRIREQRKGIAVAEVDEGTCAVCGAPVRPALSQAARLQPALQYCVSCGRILYAG